MGNEWGKRIKKKCAILLVFNSIAHFCDLCMLC